MTLRETIAKVMWICGTEWQMRGDAHDLNLFTADAILAAIRTHMTSPEAVERARAALHRVRYSRAASIVNGTFKSSDTNMSEDAEAAILAALGEE
jgi:hypothetical protein